MTGAEWFRVVEVVVMAVASGLVFSVGRSYSVGRTVEGYDRRLTELEGRMQRAGKLQSDLANDVQKLETNCQLRVDRLRTELRTDCLHAQVAIERFANLDHNITETRRELDKLRDSVVWRKR